MAQYDFHIQKGDHVGDLHIHVYYWQGKNRKQLGKYRLPGLDPLPGTEHQLNKSEVRALSKWLSNNQQLRKLQDCLKATVFNSGKLLSDIMNEGNVVAEDGKTYIVMKIPVEGRML